MSGTLFKAGSTALVVAACLSLGVVATGVFLSQSNDAGAIIISVHEDISDYVSDRPFLDREPLTLEELERGLAPDLPWAFGEEDEKGNIVSEFTGLVSQGFVDEHWRATVMQFVLAENFLPEGIYFPEQAPSFFHPVHDRADYPGIPDDVEPAAAFPPQLVQQFVAKYWQCAWMNVYLDETRHDNDRAVAFAQLEKYTYLDFSEAQFGNYREYHQSLTVAAMEQQKSVYALEFSRDCGVYIYPLQRLSRGHLGERNVNGL